MSKTTKKIVCILLMLIIGVFQFSIVFAEDASDISEKNVLTDSSLVAKYVGYGRILKTNGELWEITSETTAQKIDENVVDYAITELYIDYEFEKVELILKENLEIKYTTETTSVTQTVSNVKDVGNAQYLTNDGEVYRIVGLEETTEEILSEKVEVSDVNDLFCDFIIGNDGAFLWYPGYLYKIGSAKILNTSCFMEGIGLTYKSNRTIYLDDGRILVAQPTSGNQMHLDEQFEEYTMEQLIEIIEQPWYGFDYETQEEVFRRQFEIPDIEGLHCIVPYNEYLDSSDMNFLLLLTNDGAVYSLDDDGNVKKIIEENEKILEDDNVIKNTEIESKKLENKTAITGIEPKTGVKNFKAANNFKEGYTIKVFNTKNEELSDEAYLGTGCIVRIYNGEKLVKEYIIVIYGDTNGDGLIGAVDALGVVKNKNGNVPFKDIAFVEAGRIMSKDSEIPGAADGLAIVKHSNGIKLINQSK